MWIFLFNSKKDERVKTIMSLFLLNQFLLNHLLKSFHVSSIGGDEPGHPGDIALHSICF